MGGVYCTLASSFFLLLCIPGYVTVHCMKVVMDLITASMRLRLAVHAQLCLTTVPGTAVLFCINTPMVISRLGRVLLQLAYLVWSG